MSPSPLRRTMLLDPPWNEKGGGKVKRGADRHYDITTTPKILDVVLKSGKWNPDPACCSVWLWATVNHLPDALWLMEKLGAKYVTNAVWVKAFPRGDVVKPQAPGLGQRLRMCHEHLLFGRIGKVPVPEPANRMPSVIYSPRRRHSEKPDAAFDIIHAHDGDGSRLEFFAREGRPTWDSWGNESPAAAS